MLQSTNVSHIRWIESLCSWPRFNSEPVTFSSLSTPLSAPFPIKVFSQQGHFYLPLLLSINICSRVVLWVSEKGLETICFVMDATQIKLKVKVLLFELLHHRPKQQKQQNLWFSYNSVCFIQYVLYVLVFNFLLCFTQFQLLSVLLCRSPGNMNCGACTERVRQFRPC